MIKRYRIKVFLLKIIDRVCSCHVLPEKKLAFPWVDRIKVWRLKVKTSLQPTAPSMLRKRRVKIYFLMTKLVLYKSWQAEKLIAAVETKRNKSGLMIDLLKLHLVTLSTSKFSLWSLFNLGQPFWKNLFTPEVPT